LLLIIGWYGLILFRAIRSSAAAVAIFAAFAPFLMFDKLTWGEPSMMVVLVIAIAVIDRLWLDKTRRDGPDAHHTASATRILQLP
jgi:hypothetical protein